ncbi:MAG: hypothetical protein WAV05_13200 [Anaerolineales bacterium]
MEIEIPRRLAWYMFSILLAITPFFIGVIVSPYSEDRRPLLLTPRLVKVNQYRKDVQAWVKTLQGVDAKLKDILDEPSEDLFNLNYQIDQVFQKSKQLSEGIDQAAIPPTFEAFHQLLADAVNAYLDAISQVSQWISEPGEENRQSAEAALSTARELLNRLYANPWIEVKP